MRILKEFSETKTLLQSSQAYLQGNESGYLLEFYCSIPNGLVSEKDVYLSRTTLNEPSIYIVVS
jgi:hypothetical protein